MASWIWGASPFYEAVEKATSELLPAGSEDIALNLEICDQIRSKGVTPKEAMRALKSRLNHTNPNVQLLALNLTDICVKNGGQHFLVEIASRDFMDNLCSILRATHSLEVRHRILRYIQNWAHAFEGKATLGYANEVYKMLKSEGMVFPPLDTTVGSAAMVDSRTAPEWIDSDVCLRCRTAFTFTNRKHHCRNCGQVFCQACSSKNMPLPHFGITQEVRVCDTCATKLVKAKPERPPAPHIPPQHSRRHRPGRSHAEAEEDAELQRAIQLSIAEANAAKSSGYTPSGSKWSAPSSWGMSEPPLVDKSTRPGAEDDDDEELKAAIQASLALANAPRPSAPAAVEGDYVPSGYKPLPNYDLHPTESDAIMTFNQTIEQAGQYGGANGLRYPVVGAMYNQAAAVQPKLARSLDDTGRKAEMLSEMHDKLSQAVKLYDNLQVSQAYGQTPYGHPQQYGHPQAAYGSAQYGQQYGQYDQSQQYGQPAQAQQFGYPQQYGQPSQPQQYGQPSQPQQYATAPQPQPQGPAPGQPYGQYEQPQGQQYAPPPQQYSQQQPNQPYGQQQGYAPVSAPGQEQQALPQYVPGPYSAPPEKMSQQQPYPPEKQQYPPEKQQYISPPPHEVEQAMAPSPATLQRAGSLARSNSVMHGAQPQGQAQGQYAPQPHGQGHYAPQSNAPYAPPPEAQYAPQPTSSYAPTPQQQLPQQPQTAASIPLPQSPPPQTNYHQAFGATLPPAASGFQPTSASPAPPAPPQAQYQPVTTPTPAPAQVQPQFQPGHHPGAQSMSVAQSQPFHPGHNAGSQSMSVAPTFQQQPSQQQQQSQFAPPQPPQPTAPLQLSPQPPSVTSPVPQSPAGYMSPPPQQQQQQQSSWVPPSTTGMHNIAAATPNAQQNTFGPSQPSQLPQPYTNVPQMYSAPQPQPTYTSGPLPAFPTAPTTMPQYHGGVEKNEQKEAMLISFD